MNKAQSYLVFLVTLAVTLQDKEKGDIRTEYYLLDAMELKHFFFAFKYKAIMKWKSDFGSLALHSSSAE